MKIIATSDWHLGNLFHGNDRLPEHRNFLRWLLAKLEELRPDALLVAGDVFDNGNPSAASQAAYYEFLADATRICPEMQIVITAGNHDSANRLEAPRALLTRHNVEIRGAVHRTWMAAEEGGTWEIDYDDLMIPIGRGEDKPVVVLAVPYLRNDVVQNSSYSVGVNKFLEELTSRAGEKYPDSRLLMMAHLYANGASIARKDASEKIVIGGQEEVTIEEWIGHPDYLTCGHIHKRQPIPGTDWARYTGSILPMSFAEIDYLHGVDLLTFTDERKPLVEFIEYVPQHKLRLIPKDESELTPKKLLKLIDSELTDRGEDGLLDDDFEYVVVKVKLEKMSNDDIRAIEDLVARKNAVLCKIQKITSITDLNTIRGNETIQSIEDIIERDPLETLKEAFSIKHNREMTENQEGMLKDIINIVKENL